jgi:hypothetical protein
MRRKPNICITMTTMPGESNTNNTSQKVNRMVKTTKTIMTSMSMKHTPRKRMTRIRNTSRKAKTKVTIKNQDDALEEDDQDNYE